MGWCEPSLTRNVVAAVFSLDRCWAATSWAHVVPLSASKPCLLFRTLLPTETLLKALLTVGRVDEGGDLGDKARFSFPQVFQIAYRIVEHTGNWQWSTSQGSNVIMQYQCKWC